MRHKKGYKSQRLLDWYDCIWPDTMCRNGHVKLYAIPYGRLLRFSIRSVESLSLICPHSSRPCVNTVPRCTMLYGVHTSRVTE